MSRYESDWEWVALGAEAAEPTRWVRLDDAFDRYLADEADEPEIEDTYQAVG